MWLWFLSWISLSSSLRESTMQRCTARSWSRDKPADVTSLDPFAASAPAWRPLTTVAFIHANYSTRVDGIFSSHHGHPDRPPPSLGRDRARKSHRDAVPQSRDRRARDARADLLEAGLPRADALARERADDVHSSGRAEVSDRRRGDHGPRRRGASHPLVGRASGRGARGHLRARSVQ